MKTKFKVGTEYYSRSIAAYNCIHTVKIVRRTEKSVWVEEYGKVRRLKIQQYSNDEETFNCDTWYFTADHKAADLPADAHSHVDY